MKALIQTSPESFIGLTLLQEDYLDQSILLAQHHTKELYRNFETKKQRSKASRFLGASQYLHA